MIRKWEPSFNEQYAEKWLTDNGFMFEIKKQYIRKTVYIVHKDGLEDTFELWNDIHDMKAHMEWYRKYWKMYTELVEMRKEIKNAHWNE